MHFALLWLELAEVASALTVMIVLNLELLSRYDCDAVCTEKGNEVAFITPEPSQEIGSMHLA